MWPFERVSGFSWSQLVVMNTGGLREERGRSGSGRIGAVARRFYSTAGDKKDIYDPS